jgi:transcription-repair coupling factor (superfamily II helicase)
VLSRYGAESDGVALDKLGGEGWQRRKARMRERILEMAGQLMATAAHRALRQADVLPVDPASYGPFVDRFPWDETEDQDRAIDDVLTDMAGASRWTVWSAAMSASARPKWPCARPSWRPWPGIRWR